MEIEDASIAHYRSLHPLDYKFAEKITVNQLSPFSDDDTCKKTVEIILIKKTDHRLSRLYLNFEGISDFHLNLSNSMLQFPLLEITSIRDRQWSGVNYQVAETEFDLLSFYCESFTVHSDDENPAE
jgi:hypothetical protein